MNRRFSIAFLLTCICLFMLATTSIAQNSQYIRIAKIVVDASQLEKYKTALEIHARAAVAKEPGVIMLYAVYEKEKPTHVTVFEIYASTAAYESHIKTAHFLEYKETVKDWVVSLELVDVLPIALEAKHSNNSN